MPSDEDNTNSDACSCPLVGDLPVPPVTLGLMCACMVLLD